MWWNNKSLENRIQELEARSRSQDRIINDQIKRINSLFSMGDRYGEVLKDLHNEIKDIKEELEEKNNHRRNNIHIIK